MKIDKQENTKMKKFDTLDHGRECMSNALTAYNTLYVVLVCRAHAKSRVRHLLNIEKNAVRPPHDHTNRTYDAV